MIKREEPHVSLTGMPCLIVAVTCALNPRGYDENNYLAPLGQPELKDDGYATLTAANKYIRKNLTVVKRRDYKRGERPTLSAFIDEHKNLLYNAIICVKGHYIFAEVGYDTYYSFFDNDNDEVISVWWLEA